MARLPITDEVESERWHQLFKAWNEEGVALLYELALDYTKRYPDRYWGWVVLADALGNMARYAEAEKALRRAQRLAPADQTADIYAHWGHLYDAKCDLKRAERYYRSALKEKTKAHRMSCLIYLGGVLAKQGRFAEAEECHREAVRLSTGSADEAYYNLGLVLRAQAKYREALRYFGRAVKIDPAYTLANTAWKDVMNAMKFKKLIRREKNKR